MFVPSTMQQDETMEANSTFCCVLALHSFIYLSIYLSFGALLYYKDRLSTGKRAQWLGATEADGVRLLLPLFDWGTATPCIADWERWLNWSTGYLLGYLNHLKITFSLWKPTQLKIKGGQKVMRNQCKKNCLKLFGFHRSYSYFWRHLQGLRGQCGGT